MLNWQALGVAPADILLPAKGVDTSAYAVVACDQFTSQPDYWERAAALAAGKPSTLDMVLPEIHLEESGQRVPGIVRAMREYLRSGVLAEAVRGGMVLTERETARGVRLGLVVCADLEQYDYAPGAKSPIRPTEGTIEARIPPRLAVRREAPLELPHVLLLCDDRDGRVFRPLHARRDALRPLYDMELMLGGGRVRGFAVEGEALKAVYAALCALPCPGGMRFAVGDGNHSLATARAHWLAVKKTLRPGETHPARYALVELTNLHDSALRFEPIHRVIFGADAERILRAWRAYAAARGVALGPAGEQELLLVSGGRTLAVGLTRPEHPLTVGSAQLFLDDLLAREDGLSLDYIHGEDAVRELCARPDAVGFLLPGMDKSLLFPAVDAMGALPRKTFSMGEAREKRYYVEARRILPEEKTR